MAEVEVEEKEEIVPGGPNDLPENATDPDGDPDDFFGTEGGDGDGAQATAPADDAAAPVEPPAEPAPDAGPKSEAALPEAKRSPDPEPEAVAPPPEPEPPAEPPAEPGGKQSGSVVRGYRILEEVVLDTDKLKELAKLAKDGQPWTVYRDIGVVPARNPQGAFRAAWTKFREALYPGVTLAPISDRYWSPKSVKPKVEEDLTIE